MQYPIGKFEKPEAIDASHIQAALESISLLPSQLEKTLERVRDEHLLRSYREGGWNLRQTIHHLADSHMNAFIRFKLALTEDHPTIKAYHQDGWASTADNQADIQTSVAILKGLHARWVLLMRNILPEDWEKTFFHPEHLRSISLKETVLLYDWHGRHHHAHIRIIIDG
jgi:hypothetical protein